MENSPEEEHTDFLDQVEEIVENVVEEPHDGELVQVEHEEVLEEIVDTEVMYDSEGRIVEYQDVVVYEDGSEVIEEYVEVEDLGNGEYAYVMVDEHGNRRLLKQEEVESMPELMKKMPDMIEEEEIIDSKTMRADGAGPSSSTGYSPAAKRGRFPSKPIIGKHHRPLPKPHWSTQPSGYYPKGIAMAKVDVEKYVPAQTVNRRPLPDNHDFKLKASRGRKNPPWQDDAQTPPTSARRSPSPVIKEPLFPLHDEEEVVRFKCAECDDGFPIMDRLCEHMIKNHDCQTMVREVEFFTDREFEGFLSKLEQATLQKTPDEIDLKKSRAGSSQVFVCNYMSREHGKKPEFAEVGMAALAERPLEMCTAFVQKIHSYECIRTKYCDQHIHFDGNIGFRVPIAVKRRLFEMSFKRLPIPCMQVMLAHEAESLLPHPTKFEEKLKNFSHVEIVELLGIINASVRKYQDVEARGRKIAIKFDTMKTRDGQETLVVKRANLPKKDEPSTSAQYSRDGEEIPAVDREEEVLDDEGAEGIDGVMEENMLYDPSNGRDPLLDELTETELGVLEAYERDIGIELSLDQQHERTTMKNKFSLSKVLNVYTSLDSATHGLTSSELHTESINQLREMASYVVELVCQLDAEIKAKFNPELLVEEIKRDMIAGIAMQERVYQPERRPRRSAPTGSSPAKQSRSSFQPARSHEEYAQRVMTSGEIKMKFDTQQQRLQALRLQQQLELRQRNGGEAVEMSAPAEQKPAIVPEIPEEFKAIPWTKPPRKRQPVDPNAPSKRRGRPNKKEEAEKETVKNSEKEEEKNEKEVEKTTETTEKDKEQSVEVAVVEPEKGAEESPAPATKTRTGRVVKPKKWEDI